MAEEYDNQGKASRWSSGMRRVSDEASSIFRDLDFTPSSEGEERDQQARIERSLRNLKGIIDGVISDLYR